MQWLVDGMRCVPFLLLAYIVYYGLPTVGIRLNNWTAGLSALVIYNAAYIGEILRGAWSNLPRGYIDAAHAVGFHGLTLYRRIILPPVIFAAVPVLGNQVIQIIKDTAFLMIIAVPELDACRELDTSDLLCAVRRFRRSGRAVLDTLPRRRDGRRMDRTARGSEKVMTDHSDAIVAGSTSRRLQATGAGSRQSVQELRRPPGARRRWRERRKGQDGLHPGAERFRQIHPAALCELAREAGSRARSFCRASGSDFAPEVPYRCPLAELARDPGAGSAWCFSTSISGRT